MSIDVMLVDDHDIVRQGIKSLISQSPGLKVVAEASDGHNAVKIALKSSPDVILMDITLPGLNGLEASQKILKKNKHIKIIVLSMHENRVFIENALGYGIKGYILKESAADEIVRAIKEVHEGRYFLSTKISSYVIEDFLSMKKGTIKLKSVSSLTGREREVLQLIAEGLNSKKIAQKLELSLKTVLAHRNNIMQKLDIHNQAQLTRFALKEGLTSL